MMLCRSYLSNYSRVDGTMDGFVHLPCLLGGAGTFFPVGLDRTLFGGRVTHVQHSCKYEPENVGHARGV